MACQASSLRLEEIELEPALAELTHQLSSAGLDQVGQLLVTAFEDAADLPFAYADLKRNAIEQRAFELNRQLGLALFAQGDVDRLRELLDQLSGDLHSATG